MPGIAISTDVMVGFPGETNELFANTLNFVKEISPARTHIFTYSRRDGTPANDMPGEVAETEAKKRYLALKTVALEASYIYGASFIGKSVDVLVETKRDRGSGLLTGYSDNYIKVLFEGENSLMRTITPVKIDETAPLHSYGHKIT
jgi:threonylcarbamoyladenosine tRNA methylthiotransferase MtaB